jgi:hypothetical protein
MKNPRWGEEEKYDAAEKGTNEGIRVFTLVKRALFISTYYNGPLERQGPKYTFGFLQCK